MAIGTSGYIESFSYRQRALKPSSTAHAARAVGAFAGFVGAGANLMKSMQNSSEILEIGKHTTDLKLQLQEAQGKSIAVQQEVLEKVKNEQINFFKQNNKSENFQATSMKILQDFEINIGSQIADKNNQRNLNLSTTGMVDILNTQPTMLETGNFNQAVEGIASSLGQEPKKVGQEVIRKWFVSAQGDMIENSKSAEEFVSWRNIVEKKLEMLNGNTKLLGSNSPEDLAWATKLKGQFEKFTKDTERQLLDSYKSTAREAITNVEQYDTTDLMKESVKSMRLLGYMDTAEQFEASHKTAIKSITTLNNLITTYGDNTKVTPMEAWGNSEFKKAKLTSIKQEISSNINNKEWGNALKVYRANDGYLQNISKEYSQMMFSITDSKQLETTLGLIKEMPVELRMGVIGKDAANHILKVDIAQKYIQSNINDRPNIEVAKEMLAQAKYANIEMDGATMRIRNSFRNKALSELPNEGKESYMLLADELYKATGNPEVFEDVYDTLSDMYPVQKVAGNKIEGMTEATTSKEMINTYNNYLETEGFSTDNIMYKKDSLGIVHAYSEEVEGLQVYLTAMPSTIEGKNIKESNIQALNKEADITFDVRDIPLVGSIGEVLVDTDIKDFTDLSNKVSEKINTLVNKPSVVEIQGAVSNWWNELKTKAKTFDAEVRAEHEKVLEEQQ